MINNVTSTPYPPAATHSSFDCRPNSSPADISTAAGVEAVAAEATLKKKEEETLARHYYSSHGAPGHGKGCHDNLASSWKKSFSQIKERVVLSERDVRERHTGGEGLR